jgi:uncharacterized repeat protein (TIGR01451 family)
LKTLQTIQEKARGGIARLALSLALSAAWVSHVAQAAIDNSVVASGNFGGSPVTANTTESVDVQNATPRLTLAKTAVLDDGGDGTADAGDTIEYTIDVTNGGNITLLNVAVNDPLVSLSLPVIQNDVAPSNDSLDDGLANWDSLAPGDTIRLTGIYTLQPADIDAAILTNTATANATAASGGAVEATGQATVTLNYNPGLALAKTASLDLGPNGIANPGDLITYQFTVTNTGTVTLSNITIDDPMLTAYAPPADAEGMQTLMALLENPADPIMTASTTDITGMYAQPYRWVLDAPPLKPLARRELPPIRAALAAKRKLVNLTGSSSTPGLGDLVGIYVQLTNTGDGPLTGIRVEQPGSEAFGDKLNIIAPNTTDAASIIFMHEVTQADLEAGVIDSDGFVYANSRDQKIALTLTDPLALDAVETKQELLTADITPVNILTLPAGQQGTFTGTYALTQADIDNGTVANSAIAFGTAPAGETLQAPAGTTTAIPRAPGIVVEKVSSLNLGSDGRATPGDLITYTFNVRNTGNTTLSNVTLNDPLFTPSALTLSLGTDAPPAGDSTDTAAPGWFRLSPGDVLANTSQYPLTQANIDAGQVQNQGSVAYTTPGNPTVQTVVTNDPRTPIPNDPTITPVPQVPQIAVVKEVANVADTNASGLTDAGDVVTYRFRVQNTGNVPLTNVAVQDRDVNVVESPDPASPTGITLAVGQTDTTSFTATYVLQVADADRGYYDNTADAFGFSPNNTRVTDESDPAVFTGNAPTRVTVPQVGRIAVLKPQPSHNDLNSNLVIDLNDTLTYTVRVVNTGNITLTGVSFTDAEANNFSTIIPSIPPGGFVNVPVTITVDADHVNAGEVRNTASVAVRLPNNTIIRDDSDPSDLTENDPTVTAVVPRSGIAIVKPQPQVLDTNNNGINDAGDTLRYTFLVTNTGNVPLTNVRVSDPILGYVAIMPGQLDAGETESVFFTADYIITAADILARQVVNTASVSGLNPSNQIVTDSSHPTSQTEDGATTTPVGAPDIAIIKQQTSIQDTNSSSTLNAGDTIFYQFTVTNTGAQNLTNVTVSDSIANVFTNGNPGVTPITLAVGQSSTAFTARYVITQADMDQGFAENIALATGSFGSLTVTDNSHPTSLTEDAPTVTALAGAPSVAVVKPQPTLTDVNGNGVAEPGDTLTYRFLITNTGNVTLYDLTLSELVPGVTLTGTPIASLAPGVTNSTAYTATHVITVADSEAESFENRAEVTAATSAGGAVVTSDVSDDATLVGNDPTVTPIAPPRPALSKSAGRREIRRGETVVYTIAATGLGIGPFDIADIMPAGFSYVDATATVNTIPAAPAISGNTLAFVNLSPDPTGSITIKLTLRASATLKTGEFINRARIFHRPTGALLAEARATVVIKEEHVFDCGEIIGRVFDDINCNGYADEGEPGLPAVRVATVKGVLITTDKHGRFHVSCADVPDYKIGSNFLMKLDTRSLPRGYGLSTENPRDVRLTRGKITKLNFGACKKRDIDLDVTKDAFDPNSLDLKAKWTAGLDRLVALLEQGRGGLTITYRCGTYAPIADERVSAVADIVQAKWRDAGGTKPLKITTRVECGK